MLDPPNAKALLLTTDTELSIAPKAHARPAKAKPSISTSLSTPTHSTSTDNPRPVLATILRVLPATLPSRLPQAAEQPIACISPALLASLPSGSYNASIRVLSAPAEMQDVPTSSPTPETKHLDLGRASEGKTGVSKDKRSTMPLARLEDVPEGHVVIVGGGGLDGQAAEWNRVLYVFRSA